MAARKDTILKVKKTPEGWFPSDLSSDYKENIKYYKAASKIKEITNLKKPEDKIPRFEFNTLDNKEAKDAIGGFYDKLNENGRVQMTTKDAIEKGIKNFTGKEVERKIAEQMAERILQTAFTNYDSSDQKMKDSARERVANALTAKDNSFAKSARLTSIDRGAKSARLTSIDHGNYQTIQEAFKNIVNVALPDFTNEGFEKRIEKIKPPEPKPPVTPSTKSTNPNTQNAQQSAGASTITAKKNPPVPPRTSQSSPVPSDTMPPPPPTRKETEDEKTKEIHDFYKNTKIGGIQESQSSFLNNAGPTIRAADSQRPSSTLKAEEPKQDTPAATPNDPYNRVLRTAGGSGYVVTPGKDIDPPVNKNQESKKLTMKEELDQQNAETDKYNANRVAQQKEEKEKKDEAWKEPTVYANPRPNTPESPTYDSPVYKDEKGALEEDYERPLPTPKTPEPNLYNTFSEPDSPVESPREKSSVYEVPDKETPETGRQTPSSARTPQPAAVPTGEVESTGRTDPALAGTAQRRTGLDRRNMRVNPDYRATQGNNSGQTSQDRRGEFRLPEGQGKNLKRNLLHYGIATNIKDRMDEKKEQYPNGMEVEAAKLALYKRKKSKEGKAEQAISGMAKDINGVAYVDYEKVDAKFKTFAGDEAKDKITQQLINRISKYVNEGADVPSFVKEHNDTLLSMSGTKKKAFFDAKDNEKMKTALKSITGEDISITTERRNSYEGQGVNIESSSTGTRSTQNLVQSQSQTRPPKKEGSQDDSNLSKRREAPVYRAQDDMLNNLGNKPTNTLEALRASNNELKNKFKDKEEKDKLNGRHLITVEGSDTIKGKTIEEIKALVATLSGNGSDEVFKGLHNKKPKEIEQILSAGGAKDPSTQDSIKEIARYFVASNHIKSGIVVPDGAHVHENVQKNGTIWRDVIVTNEENPVKLGSATNPKAELLFERNAEGNVFPVVVVGEERIPFDPTGDTTKNMNGGKAFMDAMHEHFPQENCIVRVNGKRMKIDPQAETVTLFGTNKPVKNIVDARTNTVETDTHQKNVVDARGKVAVIPKESQVESQHPSPQSLDPNFDADVLKKDPKKEAEPSNAKEGGQDTDSDKRISEPTHQGNTHPRPSPLKGQSSGMSVEPQHPRPSPSRRQSLNPDFGVLAEDGQRTGIPTPKLIHVAEAKTDSVTNPVDVTYLGKGGEAKEEQPHLAQKEMRLPQQPENNVPKIDAPIKGSNTSNLAGKSTDEQTIMEMKEVVQDTRETGKDKSIMDRYGLDQVKVSEKLNDRAEQIVTNKVNKMLNDLPEETKAKVKDLVETMNGKMNGTMNEKSNKKIMDELGVDNAESKKPEIKRRNSSAGRS